MKVNLSVLGKFHTFDLARELFARGCLGNVYTGYPMFKLKNEDVPRDKICTFPYFFAPYMTRVSRLISPQLKREWEWLNSKTFGSFVARSLDECDVYVGLSGSALQAGRKVRRSGGKYVCDRGSTHIRYQNDVLVEEGDRVGFPFRGVDPRVIEQEESEYAEADLITVPSSFNVDSFVSKGISRKKIRKISYGVNLSRFHPVAMPDNKSFDVLFVGGVCPRKGVHYLIDAFSRLDVQGKRLHLVGSVDEAFLALLKKRPSWCEQIEVYGSLPQTRLKDIMSSSHVMVLASVEEGLALVQAQAMACGCPVIATENTGARDLFSDGVEGFVVPIRDPDAITERMQLLASDRELLETMRKRSIERVRALGGWSEYGAAAVLAYSELCA